MRECSTLTSTSSIMKRPSVDVVIHLQWTWLWTWICRVALSTCRRFLNEHHRCGRRPCSRDMTSPCSPDQSQIPISRSILPLLDRRSTRADSECLSTASCPLRCLMTARFLLKAAFRTRLLTFYPSQAQSRTAQTIRRSLSGTLYRGRSASLLRIRAWQKIRPPTFPFGSLRSGESWSTSQSRFLWALRGRILATASHLPRSLQEPLSQHLKTTDWLNPCLRRSCRLV